MSFQDLKTFIKELEKADELVRIKVEVSAELEIAEITDRVSKQQNCKNKALLFENVKDYKMPVLINSFGSEKRMNMALGVNSFDEIANRITEIIFFT
jgi:4-hydroxy-3-polyprenylbenzoate decarboxylase